MVARQNRQLSNLGRNNPELAITLYRSAFWLAEYKRKSARTILRDRPRGTFNSGGDTLEVLIGEADDPFGFIEGLEYLCVTRSNGMSGERLRIAGNHWGMPADGFSWNPQGGGFWVIQAEGILS